MWSSKEVLFISVATGLVFCFATIYVQNAVSKYVSRRVQERSGGNPLVGTGVASEPLEYPVKQHQVSRGVVGNDAREEVQLRDAPPGSGTRWTPL